MMSGQRKLQLACVILMGAIGMLGTPRRARAEDPVCDFCTETCNVDLNATCIANGCVDPDDPICLPSGCGGVETDAELVCKPF